LGASSVARGGAMGNLHPKPRLLSTRYNGVLAFYEQNLNINNINKAFKPILSDCTPKDKFLAMPLFGAIGVLQDFNRIPRPTTCLHNHFLENAGQAQFKFSH